MTTPTKGVDAELDEIMDSVKTMIGNPVYHQEGSIAIVKKVVKTLIRQELEAVKSEMPEKWKHDADCGNTDSGKCECPIGDRNQAITEMTEKLDKRIEAL